MKTNDLISLLAQDAPVRLRLGRMLALALAVGILVSAGLLLSTVGMRANMGSAIETIRVIFKLVVTFVLAVAACGLVFRVGRPGASLTISAWLLLPVAALVIAVASEMSVVPAEAWRANMMGRHAAFCVFFIPVLALAPLAGFLLALRNGAPESPGLAGAVAGLAAGAIAAATYAWHCPDDSPLFVAAWYTLAITLVTGLGALLGSRLLRW
ncbi:NrsF family protein [Rhizobium sp. HT1-10]|uniref:NrsF family protein n=1 Tax=Rhizobium sp. HT1-10 TaxID=3111638 RepID=UPI003C236875